MEYQRAMQDLINQAYPFFVPIRCKTRRAPGLSGTRGNSKSGYLRNNPNKLLATMHLKNLLNDLPVQQGN